MSSWAYLDVLDNLIGPFALAAFNLAAHLQANLRYFSLNAAKDILMLAGLLKSSF